MISTRTHDDFVYPKPLGFCTMYKWEDENWTKENFTANYSRNDSDEALPYVLIPCSPGKFSVYVECQGFMVVKARSGNYNGNWLGCVAYNVNRSGWVVQEYSGCKITNYKVSHTFVSGHPDVVLNDCHFHDGQGVECDSIISFHLECDVDGFWALQPPPIQKNDHYNYVVSYGDWSDKTLEWGSVSISVDEINQGACTAIRGKQQIRETLTSNYTAPAVAGGSVHFEKENSDKPVEIVKDNTPLPEYMKETPRSVATTVPPWSSQPSVWKKPTSAAPTKKSSSFLGLRKG